MRLDPKYHLLSVRNETVFSRVDGTPEFSPYIADLAFKSLDSNRTAEPMTIWDPYCGSGVILRTISVLHRSRVKKLFASDIRPEATEQTEDNLSKCTTAQYTRNDAFRDLLVTYGCVNNVETSTFIHSAIDSKNQHIPNDSIDMLISDPPYEGMEAFFEKPETLVTTVEGYLPILLSSVRVKLKDSAKVGLILDTGFEDVLSSAEGYKFQGATAPQPKYRNRILYSLHTCS